jgi:hypothetical protein
MDIIIARRDKHFNFAHLRSSATKPGFWSRKVTKIKMYQLPQTLPQTPTDIQQLLEQLKASGELMARSKSVIDKKLEDLNREANKGQIGAQGEIVFLQRKIFLEDKSVEFIPPSQKARVTRPDFRVRAAKVEVIEIKTAVKAPKLWESWLKQKIKAANKQIKYSQLRVGLPGALELQLFDDAATSFQQTSLNDFEQYIRRNFRVDQMTRLQRVAIYTNGQLALEFIRAIVRSFP